MVVNYSKWDALELSDDSDIEVHPNVDKKSFIRAKQNQIHQERENRRHEIKTLKYESIINDGMLQRIDALLVTLRDHANQAVGAKPEEFIMQALLDSTASPEQDQMPKPPSDVHYKVKQPSTYSEMISGLVDQVKKEVEPEPDDWYKSYIGGVEGHKAKVQDLQTQLHARLEQLEKDEARHITSDSIYTGFNSSSVSKESKGSKKTEDIQKPKAETVEVLNPGSLKRDSLKRLDSGGQGSGADADIDETPKDPALDDDEDTEVTELGKMFAKIEIGQYNDCLGFISRNPEILAEKETDGLLMEAFGAQMDGKAKYAKQCVHQALLIQYCRSLGKDGVQMFFKRVTTPGHKASTVFFDDVDSTYERIRTRTAELAKERSAGHEATEVEQIQLHAVEPGTEIHINIPQPDSNEEVEREARLIYERFPPGMQRALETGSLDRVNEVLGKMSVSEAEEIVEQMGNHAMLSMEQGVIDGTTEEGQTRLKELEREAQEQKASRTAETESNPDSTAPELALQPDDEEIQVAGPD